MEAEGISEGRMVIGMSISPTLKAYLHLECAVSAMTSVNDAWAAEICGVMDSLWNELSSSELSWLNERDARSEADSCPCEL